MNSRFQIPKNNNILTLHITNFSGNRKPQKIESFEKYTSSESYALK